MTRLNPVFAGVMLLLATAGAAQAQLSTGDPSVYLKCDGNPAHRSEGEKLGRLVVVLGTMGLAGQGEVQDVSKRAFGIDGVDACDSALLAETDPIRKAQLMMARSIHHVEAKDYNAALDDARKVPGVAGPAADDLGFRHSLGLSAMELQAAALVRQGDLKGAETAGLQMADAAPYDIIAQVRAAPYAQLTAELTPQKQAYLNRLVKLLPPMLAFRATLYQWSGKYLEAASDYNDMIEQAAGFSPGNTAPPLPAVVALRAAMLAMAGKMDEATALVTDTNAMIHVLETSGKATLMQQQIDGAGQALDFEGIIADLAAGRAGVARVKFAARSHWSVPPPVLADLTARLRQGAPAAELTGPLATDPAQIRADGLTANAGAITEAVNADGLLYGMIRVPVTADAWRAWDDVVWNARESRLLHVRAANENYIGDFITATPPPKAFQPVPPLTIASGEAMLMHAAVLAQARGMKGFELAPVRQQYQSVFLRFGNPGDPGMPASTTFDAATVVADLSGEFPNPAAHP